MSQPDSTFYVTGGTLRQDAACYVERQADKDLLDGLLKGEFCYVLTSRQMGKSSLMVRTAGKLREQGVRVAVLDLTAVGQPESREQWYFGLLTRLGVQTRLEDELEEFWLAHPALAPVQRFFSAIREVLLAQGAVISNQCSVTSDEVVPQADLRNTGSLNTGRLVVFVDELDVVRSLSFSTDEFFAAIRECYTRRAEDPEFQRLTFCLLGVATPSDLIRDTRITPFNIGRRIELNDFTPEEAAPLAGGLEGSSAANAARSTLLDRILHWTNGHPYLTQRLCQAAAANRTAAGASGVDQSCAELFFTTRAREQDDNLLFVRERLLRCDADLATLLHFYEQVCSHKRVPDDETNPLVSALRLSGVTRARNGCLEGRNRIYERVFDREWIRANMPDAEVRRQKEAFRRGVIRTASVAAVLLAAFSVLALYARRQARRAESEARTTRQVLYAADMNIAQQAIEAGNRGRALDVLERNRPGPGQSDLRHWEWRYLWELCRSDELATLGSHDNAATGVAFSPDGLHLASSGHDGVLKLWDLRSGLPQNVVSNAGPLAAVAFSPDGASLATIGEHGTILLAVRGWRSLMHLNSRSSDLPGGLAFSPDSRRLAAGTQGPEVDLWDLSSRSKAGSISNSSSQAAAFSPDGRWLALGDWGREITLWDASDLGQRRVLTNHTGAVQALSFSRDGKLLLSASWDKTVRVWDTSTWRPLAVLTNHTAWVSAVALSPDNNLLATASADQTIRLWKKADWKLITTLRGHLNEVWCVAFSPDGRLLASASKDGAVKLWRADKRPAPASRFEMPLDDLSAVRQGVLAVSPDHATVAGLTRSGTLRLWKTSALREAPRLVAAGTNISVVAVGSEGELLALGDEQGRIELRAAANNQRLAAWNAHSTSVVVLEFSQDNQTLFSLAANGNGKLWNAHSRQMLTQVDVPQNRFCGLAFSPDSRLFALASSDWTIRLWDVGTLRQVAVLEGHKGQAFSLAFSPDGKTLASCSTDGTTRLWDLKERCTVATFRGQLLAAHAVTFSPDGQRLAVGTGEGTVKLLDVGSRQEVVTLRGNNSEVTTVFFADANTLVSASPNELLAWSASPDEGFRPEPYRSDAATVKRDAQPQR